MKNNKRHQQKQEEKGLRSFFGLMFFSHPKRHRSGTKNRLVLDDGQGSFPSRSAASRRSDRSGPVFGDRARGPPFVDSTSLFRSVALQGLASCGFVPESATRNRYPFLRPSFKRRFVTDSLVIRDRLGDSGRWIYSNSLPDGRRGHNGDIGMVSSPLFKISGQAPAASPRGLSPLCKKNGSTPCRRPHRRRCQNCGFYKGGVGYACRAK